MERNKITDLISPEEKVEIQIEVESLRFTKNFRSATAEEWYIFLDNYHDPQTGGAVGKAIIHYDLYGNRDIFINTTILFDDPRLHKKEKHQLVYAVAEEIINRLVGYADTLLSVHSGENSYNAEYLR